MKQHLFIKQNIIIPEHELEITASRSGGPGGQHVNKTSSRITVRWNVRTTHSMPDYLKERIIERLGSQISIDDGDIIIHNSSSRSQQQNKEAALKLLTSLIRTALHVPKKRIPTKISTSKQETRLHKKTLLSRTKKLRSRKIHLDE